MKTAKAVQDSMENLKTSGGNPITKRFGVEAHWLTAAEIEKESGEEIVTGDPANAADSSPIPPNEENSNPRNTGVFSFQELMAQHIERPREIVEGLICERQNVSSWGDSESAKLCSGHNSRYIWQLGEIFWD